MADAKDDRFGFSNEIFDEALRSHGNSEVFRAGMYVPNREEVFSLPIPVLTEYLIEWLYESPTELIPTNQQIREVKKLLCTRPDAHECQDLIDTCDAYLRTA